MPRAAADTYGVGERVEISVTFTVAVNATANTDFVLSVSESGRKRAPLLRGSGTKTLVFGYTVLADDEYPDGIFIGAETATLVGNRNGEPQDGTITAVATGEEATLEHTSVGVLSEHKLDGSLTPPANAAPVITTTSPVETPENGTAAATLEATDADDDPISWSKTGGADATRFALTDAGVLTFVTAPNYESPADVASADPANDASNNEYVVFVTAGDGADFTELELVVRVTNANEGPSGTVTIDDTTPRVDDVLTAEAAGVADPDGLPDPFAPSWQWYRTPADGGETVITGETAATYTVVVADLGAALTAKLIWTDGGGFANTLPSAPTSAVGYRLPMIVPNGVSITSTAPGDDSEYVTGDMIRVTVTFDRAVTVDRTSGTPSLALTVGANTRAAAYSATESTAKALVFAYPVTVNDQDEDGISIAANALELNGGAIHDQGETSANALLEHTDLSTQSSHKVNLPAVIVADGVEVTSTPRAATETYGAGETIEISVTFSRPVNATTDTDFELSVAGAKGAPLLRGSGTATLVFGYTVLAADTDDDGIWIGDQDRTLVGNRNANPQTGTITSVATGRAAVLTHGQIGTLSGHKVNGSLVAQSVVAIAADHPAFTARLDHVTFTLTRTITSASALTVAVALTQEQDLLGSEDLAQNVTFGAGEDTATLRISQDIFFDNPATGEPTLTATLQPGSGYVPGSPDTASTRIRVVAGPAVTVWIEETAYTFDEGVGTDAIVAVILRTATGVPVPHGRVPVNVTLKSTPGQAEVSVDYASLAVFVWAEPSDFTPTGTEFTARKEVTLAIVDDALAELDETVTLRLERAASTPGAVELTRPDGTACPMFGQCNVTVTITDNDENTAPVIATASPVAVAENGTAVATLAATDADDHPIAWSKTGGADANRFALTDAGVLTFVAAPNYESPEDAASADPANAAANNEYLVFVTASDRIDDTEFKLVVQVTNADEGQSGTVSIDDTAPKVGAALTASTVDVDDPDGLPDPFAPAWQWYRTPAGGAETVISGATSATYTVVQADFDAALTAKASWTDVGGFANTLASAPSAPTASAGICDRTTQVQTAILGEISGVDDCAEVTVADLATITTLSSFGTADLRSLQAGDFAGLTSLGDLSLTDSRLTALPGGVFSGLTSLERLSLNNNELSSLPAAVFSGLTSLQYLRLNNNQLRSLPDGVFSGVTSLQRLDLRSNPGSPLPVAVSLELAGSGQFNAVAPTAAPFALRLHVRVDNGVIDGGDATLTIPAGMFRSASVSVTRRAGSTAAVTADIQTLPMLPSDHEGYALEKSSSLPLEVFAAEPEGPTPVCDRTPRVIEGIVAQVPGVSACGEVTDAHLAAIAVLALDSANIMSLKEGDFSGLTALTDLDLSSNQLRSLPEGVFSGLTALTDLDLSSTQLGSLPDGVFSSVTALTDLDLSRNQLRSLPEGVFSGLTALTDLDLSRNQLGSLPDGVFSGLTALTDLDLSRNQLGSLPAGVFSSLTALETLNLQSNSVDLRVAVSLELAGAGQIQAVAPTGAPFALTLPVRVVNGEIDGGATTLTIAAGMVRSASVSVTRSAGSTAAVTADIGTLPALPSGHQGYALEKSSSLPLNVLAEAPTLSALTVSVGGTDLLTFASSTTTYMVTVANEVETVTFTATKNDAGARVAYLDSDGTLDDADTTEDGFQVVLEVGANAITVRVTAEDGMTALDYTVTVTRAEAPRVTVAAAAGGETVTEGTDAAFTLSRTGSTTAALTVAVAVSQTGSVLQDASAVPSSVTFAAGAATATLALATNDDDTDNDNGTVTVTLGAGDGYQVGTPRAATVAVSDNDVPVDFVLAVPARVAEDAGTATVTVTATTAENAPPARGASVQLARVGGTATGGDDYVSVSETARFLVSDFAAAMVDGQPRYQAVWTYDVVIHDDEVVEGDETVVLEMSPTSGFLPIHTLGGVGLDAVRKTLTIVDNDTLPTVTVAAATGGETVPEGTDAAFTLSRTGSTSAALTVTVAVSQTGSVLNDASAVPSSVTFAAGAATATLALATDDDDTDDDDGTVTVTLGADTGYTVGEPGAATVAVSDNDVPVDFVLAVPARVAEDAGTATVTVTATTAENAPPATLVEVQLARVGGTATGGTDYDAVSETVRFQVSDFAAATVDGQPRYQAEWTYDVVIHDDEVVEDDETVVLAMSPTLAFLLIHTLDGSHDAVRATLTIVDNDVLPNVAPSFTSPETFTPEENQTTVGTVAASDDDMDDAITGYALSGGADQALFAIDGTTGALTFLTAPDYEDPQDADTDNAYVVEVQATSGTGDRVQMETQTITVTVTNVDEGRSGTVSIDDTAPMVRDELTASTAGVADPDGLPDPFAPTWQWYRTPAGGAEAEISGATSATYTVVEADLGAALTAKASWTDAGGFTNTLASASTAAVTPGVPAAPSNLLAAPGDTTVALSWDAPAATIARHEYRFKTDGSYPAGWTAITDSAPGGGNATGITVPSLTNGLAYTFQVRAVDMDGVEGEPAESATVTPAGGICARTPQVQTAILDKISGVDDCAVVTATHLSRISDLNLNSAGIGSLQSNDFAGLSSMTRLDLKSNDLAALPPGVFSGLSSLQTLDFRTNDLAALRADVFSGLSSLSSLSLWANKLTALPAGVFSGLSSLARLYLNDNSLNELRADVFSGLSSLEQLYLSYNSLNELPAGVFSGLSSLERLYLDHNDFTALPEDVFSGLSSLVRLHLNDNSLNELPEDVFSGLSSLERLQLGGNGFTALPEGVFSGLSNLN